MQKTKQQCSYARKEGLGVGRINMMTKSSTGSLTVEIVQEFIKTCTFFILTLKVSTTPCQLQSPSNTQVELSGP